jgi:microcystin-dependent protein
MTDYNKSVNFAVKDTLTAGDPNKIVSGAEIDTEFNSISSASTTKIDKVPAAGTGNVAKFTATGAIEDTGSSASALIPSGGIIMWSGLIASIPTGWGLCDGSNGTPDLRNRFIVGAGDAYDRNDTGGSDSVTLTEGQIPSHDHTGTTSSDGSHSHSGSTSTDGDHNHVGPQGVEFPLFGSFGSATRNADVGGGVKGFTSTEGDHSHSLNINSNGDHNHSFTTDSTGGGESHENRPPYFALAFIMKL